MRAATGVPEATIRSLAETGDDYRELLERDDLDFDFQRGLIDDLDIRGIVGVEQESGRKHAEFVYCGKTKRKYLDDDADTGNSNEGNYTGAQANGLSGNSLGSVLSSQNLFIRFRRYLDLPSEFTTLGRKAHQL